MSVLTSEAQNLLLYQFSKSPKLNGLLKALIEPFEEALTHIEKLHHGKYVDEASSYSLDVIGDIVDFKRKNMSDDEYKQWLKVAILLNNSHGTERGVYHILKVLYGKEPDVMIEEKEPNIVLITFFTLPNVPSHILFAILRRAMPLNITCKFTDATKTH